MGSIQPSPPSSEKEITILLTGFGPFRAQYPVNPSWEIVRSLGPFLDIDINDGNEKKKKVRVRLLVHPSPVKVAYESVRVLVPGLWDRNSNPEPKPHPSNSEEWYSYPSSTEPTEKKRIDYAIHIGMAGGRNYYSIERRGHRDGYDMRDVDGKGVEGWTDDWVEGGCPVELESELDVEGVWRGWTEGRGMEKEDLRISEDAGRYLCDFIYYTSLSHLYKKNEPRRVLFLHVPVESNDVAIEKGVRILEELIKAVVRVGEEAKEGGKVVI